MNLQSSLIHRILTASKTLESRGHYRAADALSKTLRRIATTMGKEWGSNLAPLESHIALIIQREFDAKPPEPANARLLIRNRVLDIVKSLDKNRWMNLEDMAAYSESPEKMLLWKRISDHIEIYKEAINDPASARQRPINEQKLRVLMEQQKSLVSDLMKVSAKKISESVEDAMERSKHLTPLAAEHEADGIPLFQSMLAEVISLTRRNMEHMNVPANSRARKMSGGGDNPLTQMKYPTVDITPPETEEYEEMEGLEETPEMASAAASMWGPPPAPSSNFSQYIKSAVNTVVNKYETALTGRKLLPFLYDSPDIRKFKAMLKSDHEGREVSDELYSLSNKALYNLHDRLVESATNYFEQ